MVFCFSLFPSGAVKRYTSNVFSLIMCNLRCFNNHMYVKGHGQDLENIFRDI